VTHRRPTRAIGNYNRTGGVPGSRRGRAGGRTVLVPARPEWENFPLPPRVNPCARQGSCEPEPSGSAAGADVPHAVPGGGRRIRIRGRVRTTGPGARAIPLPSVRLARPVAWRRTGQGSLPIARSGRPPSSNLKPPATAAAPARRSRRSARRRRAG